MQKENNKVLSVIFTLLLFPIVAPFIMPAHINDFFNVIYQMGYMRTKKKRTVFLLLCIIYYVLMTIILVSLMLWFKVIPFIGIIASVPVSIILMNKSYQHFVNKDMNKNQDGLEEYITCKNIRSISKQEYVRAVIEKEEYHNQEDGSWIADVNQEQELDTGLSLADFKIK